MKINDIYKNLTSDQKISFWTMTTNIVLVVFTAWLGFLVQDIIVSKNTNIQSKLVQYEYGEKLFPALSTIYANGNPYSQIAPIVADKNMPIENKREQVYEIMSKDKDAFTSLGDSVITVMGALKYYVDYKYSKEISKNNGIILMCNAIISEVDSIKMNPDYKIDKNLISNLLNSKEYYLYCGINSANRAEIDSLYTEYSKLIDVNSIRSTLEPCFLYQSEAVLGNLIILQELCEDPRRDSSFKNLMPFLLLFGCFLCIIISMWIISNYIVPKGIHRKHSDEDYNKLQKKYKAECMTTSVRDNTIFRLNQEIENLKQMVREQDDNSK